LKGTLERPFNDIFELIEVYQQTQPIFNQPTIEALFAPLFYHDDKFQPIMGTDKKVRLFPNRQMMNLYRGQVKAYPKCFPSLYRQEQGTIQQLIDMIKTVEFELALKQHPVVKELEQDDLFIDYVGLAQHYGLKTNVLDLTSDLEVAAFFACCPYDPLSNSHNFDIEEDSIGVIYQTLQIALFDHNNPSKFEVIGLQPFHRPAQQKGYSYQLDLGEDFLTNCTPIYFKHSRKASEEIFMQFNGGEALYPYDPIVEIARKVNEGNTLSKIALHTAVNNGSNFFKKDPSVYEQKLKELGFRIIDEPVYQFTEEDNLEIKEEWESGGRQHFYSQIQAPRLMYKSSSGKHYLQVNNSDVSKLDSN
jgi:hypothetical protein